MEEAGARKQDSEDSRMHADSGEDSRMQACGQDSGGQGARRRWAVGA
jgi:hypothetical protein